MSTDVMTNPKKMCIRDRYQSVSCLSTTFLFFVLHLKFSFLMHQLVYNNIRFPECQALFSTFFTFS